MTDLTPLDRAIRAARRGHHEAARRLLDDVLAAAPDDERALTWRARVTDDPAEKAYFLTRTVDLNPDNRWAADQLAALGHTDAEAPVARPGLDDVGRQPEALLTLQCPHCGGQVAVHTELGTQSLACRHCGSVLDVTAAQATVLGRFKRQYTPSQDIQPGAEFTWEGERHLVSGWLRYEGWDDEDRWAWDEWQLIGDTGAVRYLSHSEDGFLLQTPIRPTPRVTRQGIELADGVLRFHEVSPAAIISMAGELTWRPRLHETLQVAEGRDKGRYYSAEMTADEIEVVVGPQLSELELWHALGWTDRIEALEARQASVARRRRSAARSAGLWLVGAAVLIAAGLLAPRLGSEITTTALTYKVEPVALPFEATERILVATDTVDLGLMAIPEGAFVGTVTAQTPPGTAGPLQADLAFVVPPADMVYPLGLPNASGSTVRVSSPRSLNRTTAPRTTRDEPHRLVLLVAREWGGGAPWTEPASVQIRISLRRVWTPDPFWFAGAFSLFMAAMFFLFSRSGSRE